MNEYQWNGSFFTVPFITEATTVAIHNAAETNLLIQCEFISLRAYEPTSLRAYEPKSLRAYESMSLRAYEPTSLRAYEPTSLRA